MEWKRLTAVFGKLDNHTLELKEGFNLIYAPNESGKSTWCAFLRAMLYGLPSRDRKTTADKNRYAPWSGKAMAGQADLSAGGIDLTIIRQTPRIGAPMSAFTAHYSSTGTDILHLSAASCGEALTGVPREVFERSAFISQSSMVIDQEAELERRITALMSNGEETVSYTETADRLKKQLYKRRYHKSGLLPTLESDRSALQQRLQDSRLFSQQLREHEAALAVLEQQEEMLLHQLTEIAPTTGTDTHREFAQLQRQAEQADALVQKLRVETDSLPSRKVLAAMKSAAGSILVNQLTLRNAHTQTQLREAERLQAQATADAHPIFSGLTGEEGRSHASKDKLHWQRHLRNRKLLLTAAAFLPLFSIATGAAIFLTQAPSHLSLYTVLLLLPFPLCLILAKKQQCAAKELLAAYGNSEDSFSQQAEEYYITYSKLIACRNAENDTRAREKKLENDLRTSQEQIIRQALSLAPTVSDLSSATAAIDRAISAWTHYEAARQAQEQLYARCEALSAIIGDAQDPSDEIRSRLRDTRADIQDARRQCAALQSQLQQCGEETTILSLLAEKEQQCAVIQKEYDAIAAALDALAEANATLQNRFSPELGKKSAKYFAKLTKGKYNNVLLNRELEASVLQADSPAPRPFHQLSQGAAEQLYLAVRLAICDLVLPQEKAVPLVLDDALSTFDDERMEATLDVLMEVSENRQVLFFTCQKREADYLHRAYPGQFSYTEL